MPVPNPVIIHARLPTALAERARAAAEAEDRSISYLTRRALERELERLQDEDTTQTNGGSPR
jgi:predicted transcriptional regulator